MVISLMGGLSPLAMVLTLTLLGGAGGPFFRKLALLILLPASLGALLDAREGVLSPCVPPFLSRAVRTKAAEPRKLLLCLSTRKDFVVIRSFVRQRPVHQTPKAASFRAAGPRSLPRTAELGRKRGTSTYLCRAYVLTVDTPSGP